jgi:hypothetical protein
MKKSLVNRYFLNGREYYGEVYIKADRTSKSGFACYASPNFTDKLEIHESEYKYKLASVSITQEPTGKPPNLDQDLLITQGKKLKLSKDNFEVEQKVHPINIMYMVCPIVIFFRMLF